MTRQITLPTRSLGAEPAIPDKDRIIRWINGRRGLPGDLMTFLLTESLPPQKKAGITLPCTGGPFYAARVREALLGPGETVLKREPETDSSILAADLAEVHPICRGVWFSFPAPGDLGIADGYFKDQDEFQVALRRHVKRCIRSLRDGGAGGVVLLAKTMEEEEITALTGRDVIFWITSPDEETFSLLLEVQKGVVTRREWFPVLLPLLEDYPNTTVRLLDPDRSSLSEIFEFRDPGQVESCGFCSGGAGRYWEDLAAGSTFTI